ncbi:NACHT domain-containing protein [Streptomyces bohaiensis]|uniref:NACHT domain-containing protein n=1 Tax=Streptomyces bohaiensis TaxID=1431344 RepID=A0ABX1CBU3_9ACTN|nr:NACHT domain-containing protein [Streptomyces bohaiensis]NJQ15746.1 NACHT domain-containing protein [Streptomyces bohaiensis]
MDPIAAGARIASAFAAPLIKRLFRRDGPGAGLVYKPVRVSDLVAFKGEKDSLSDSEMTRIGEELVERALKSQGPEEQLPGYEVAAVKNAVIHTLRSLGDLEMSDVQAVQLGERRLTQLLLTSSPSSTMGLSRDAIYLHESVVRAASLHILHFFTQRSTFIARTLVEQTRSLNELLLKVDSLIMREPAPGDSKFERRYNHYIEDHHGELSIFGLDLTESPDRWPLGAAYLSLQAHKNGELIHAEQVLAAHDKVLLRGVAGSGKTTLIQWLATATCRSTRDEKTHYLKDLVAISLPLRRLTKLPSPADFLEVVGCPIADSQPDGWAARVLSEGRGLVLVDGIDEIEESRRFAVRNWLRGLTRAYPNNRWLVTSRPSAVRESWLGNEGFTEVDLMPMTRENVAAFIVHWHDAAGVGDSYAKSLQHVIWSKPDLGNLANNPLMCALICALHRDRRGYLPDSRKEMYDAALSMLLARRDRERGIDTSGAPRINEISQVRIAQKLAYWMIKNSRVEISRSDTISLLDQVIPTMQHIDDAWKAEDVYRHFLVRSGLLREPTVQKVEFIHRTFQDFLGAKAAVEELDFDFLVSKAHLDQWEDVLRMAVAHARPAERARILKAIMKRGNQAPTAQRFHLLAAACLEHATELDPQVWLEVQTQAAKLLPPRSMPQVTALTAAGPVVLELLPRPEEITPEERYYCVLTATRIATDAALPVLVKYRQVEDVKVRRELARAWRLFDTNYYAEEVIEHIRKDDFRFPFSSSTEIAIVDAQGGVREAEFRGDFSDAHGIRLGKSSRLQSAQISIEENSDWSWLKVFENLRHVQVSTHLDSVDLSSLSSVSSLARITVPRNVEILGLDRQKGELSKVFTAD